MGFIQNHKGKQYVDLSNTEDLLEEHSVENDPEVGAMESLASVPHNQTQDHRDQVNGDSNLSSPQP